MMIRAVEKMVPGQFLKAVADGAAGRWLNRIAELTEPQKKLGRNTAAMWEQLVRLVEAIPRGKWVSYGDLAKAIRSAAQPVGNYLAVTPIKNAHRVLRADGTISEGFGWHDDKDHRSPKDLLTEEGVYFDDAGRAAPAQRWKISG